MKEKKKALLLVTVAAVAILGYAYEHQIRVFFSRSSGFDLTRIGFHDMAGRTYQIPEGYRGYVVFYSDLSGCTSCLRRLGPLKRFSEVYEEVGMFSILNDDTGAHGFAELMTSYDVPGEYLQDKLGQLKNRLHLGEHPLLLFFNRDQKLIAILPLDVEYEDLRKLLHQYANEM
ncbi:hypothetical protein SCOR_31350 [Sulfidibacter corallicola]|uniref:Uncharacterized protein n=1 Tax=Sulfidibacter corallicola TaxID=2818388 RepID=A0A8A4TLG3_SULCO|nr:hypothetical protein [Sulfidibacter corallicola]QTD49952.1 hypothetical protein J3U87_30590 [Sulfidibacter corallicola]